MSRPFLDQQPAHDAPFLARLRRLELQSDNFSGQFRGLLDRSCEFHPPRFAPPARMNLRLHHHDGCAQPLRCCARFLFRESASPRGTGTPNLARMAFA